MTSSRNARDSDYSKNNNMVVDEVNSGTDNQETLLQVELSHASTAEQPAIYQGNSEDYAAYGPRAFCCDLVSVLFLLAVASFLILLIFNHIPSLASYFKAHPHDKTVVVMVVSVISAFVFLTLIVRCACRICGVSHSLSLRHDSCCESIRKRKNRKMYDRFKQDNDQINGGERTIAAPLPPPQSVVNDWTPGLADLSDTQLEDVKKILMTFLADNDVGDWLFSPSSLSAISRPGGFAENQKFNSVKESIKMKLGIKVILVGQPNVGKTSIFHRILYDRFSEYYMATLGADLAHVCLHLYPGQPERHLMVSIQLWDIAGSERFSDLSHIVYRDATAFVVVCDLTRPDPLKQAEPWVADIMKLRYDPYVALFLNKVDVQANGVGNDEMRVSNEIRDGLDQYSVSAKTGEHVLNNVLRVLIKSMLHEIEKLL